MRIGYFLTFLSSLFGGVPSGSYCGSKTILGETIGAVVNFQDAQFLDFAISGDFALDCHNEAYSQSGADILLRDIGVSGDCAHDALSENKITLQHITYDSASNTIDVSVKYSVLKLSIPLTVC
jgi:hypothetical protein